LPAVVGSMRQFYWQDWMCCSIWNW